MKAISLFSGVGGFDLGFDRAGIETVLQVERDPHCLAVLERHWPNVRRLTDVRECQSRLGEADIVYGGWPCLGHSVAGARKGFEDERSGLWYEFERIVENVRPKWVVAENVTGLLSQPEFHHVVSSLDRLGYVGAWRVLSATGFGLPQSRRRVFIVAALGTGGGNPGQVLFEPEGSGGVCEAIGTAGEEPALAPHGRPAASLPAGESRCADCGDRWCIEHDEHYVACGCPGDEVQCLECEEWWLPDTDEPNCLYCGWQPYAPWLPKHVGTLNDGAHHGGGLNGQDIYSGRIIVESRGPRRLTPLECERLQGFPDGWTEFKADGTRQSDSNRYRQMGNAVAVPVAEWIGHRLMAVES